MYAGIKVRRYDSISYFYVPEDKSNLKVGDRVVVDVGDGLELGKIVCLRLDLPEAVLEEEVKPILRKATPQDFKQERKNRELSKEAFFYCREKIKELGLDMKLVRVAVRLDRSKILFYFTAPMRVDFRELVKVLVKKYKTRIELRQIGVRHEAQMVGGIGNCGRICCCHLILKKFEPITIKMAKEQQLFLNPTKISGTCGRLLCCLNYEKEIYEEFQNLYPKVGKRYMTSLGEVKVLRTNYFRKSVVVEIEEKEREFHIDEWSEICLSEQERTEQGEGNEQ